MQQSHERRPMLCMASRLVCVDDYEQEARLRLDRNAWIYFSTGSDAGQTLRDNLDAFSRLVSKLV